VSSENFFCTKFFYENSTGADLYNSTAVLENDSTDWSFLYVSFRYHCLF